MPSITGRFELRRDTRVGEREEVARCRAQGQRKCEGAGETESEREREKWMEIKKISFQLISFEACIFRDRIRYFFIILNASLNLLFKFFQPSVCPMIFIRNTI